MKPRSYVFVLLSALLATWSIDHASADRMSREERKRLKSKKMKQMAVLKEARNFRKLRVPGEEVNTNVTKLTSELNWHKSLAAALAEARKQGRPVQWIQALGELTGYL